MSVYSNKFIIEAGGDVVRVVFSDERARVADGLPMAIREMADVVMTRENALDFFRVGGKLLGLIPG